MRMSTLLAVAFAPIGAVACGESGSEPVANPVLPTIDASSDARDATTVDVSISDAGSADADADAGATTACGGGLVDDFENAWSSSLRWDATLDRGTGSSAPANGGRASAASVRFSTSHYADAAGLLKKITGACPLRVEAMINLVSGANNDDLVMIALGLSDGRSLDVKLVRGPVTRATLLLSDEQSKASSDKVFPSKQWTKVVLDYVPSTGDARVTVGDEVWANLVIAPSTVSNVRIGVIRCANTSEGAEPNNVLFDDVTIQN